MQQLNVRISPSCPLDIRSEETCRCTSVLDQRLWSLSFFLLFFLPLFLVSFFMGTPFSYIAPFKSSGPYTCWSSGPSFTWVPVPSDISPVFLWVVVAKVTLFACLLHINAVRKVAVLYLMWQLWSDSLLLVGCMFELYLARSRRHLSSDRL